MKQKKLVLGQRPVQEFPFIKQMFWEYLLREICAGKQLPHAKKQVLDPRGIPVPMIWDFDQTVMGENGQDMDIGDSVNNVWGLHEFTFEL